MLIRQALFHVRLSGLTSEEMTTPYQSLNANQINI